MAAFRPRGVNDFASEKASSLEGLRALNPDTTEETHLQHVSPQVRGWADPIIQFHLRFDARFMAEYVLTVLSAHALCEAVINAILAIGLGTNGAADSYWSVECDDVKEKWRIGPEMFCPTYELGKGTALYATLARLTKQRNALAHSKVALEIEGTLILPGLGIERMPYSLEVASLRRFFSLPYGLASHASTATALPTSLLYDSSPIERVSVHS